MTQLVLQPCAFGAPLDHFKDTVLPPVLLEPQADLLNSRDLGRLRAAADRGRVALWGIVPNGKRVQYERLREGARVLFINTNEGFYTGVVTYRFHNPELAERLWGRDERERTWEYMYSIGQGQPIEVDGQLLKRALGYEVTANFQGFTVVEDDRAGAAVVLVERALRDQRSKPLPKNRKGQARSGSTLGQLTDRTAVLTAIKEFDGLGREAFLAKYGFGKATSYVLEHSGREYDSKAIAGAALAYQPGVNRALPNTDFNGGENGAAARLRILGFTVRNVEDEAAPDSGPPADAAPPEQQAGARVQLVDSENNSFTEFTRAPASGLTALRTEAQLVDRYEGYLRDQGHSVGRLRIQVTGELTSLVTDTYDVTDGFLYEAKSACDRATIRLAVGQLMDYMRFVPDAKGRLLLPTRPSRDLIAFIHSVGFDLVFDSDGEWTTLKSTDMSRPQPEHTGSERD